MEEHGSVTLGSLAEFRPSMLDPSPPPVGDDSELEWLKAPCSVTRDSGPMEQSNFQACLELLGGEGDDVHVLRFRHWACGWLEVITVRPGSEKVAVLENIAERLSGYPLLDEDDLYKREADAFEASWTEWARHDFLRELRKHVPEETVDRAEDLEPEKLFSFFKRHEHGYGSNRWDEIDIPRAAKAVDIEELEEFLNAPDGEPATQGVLGI